MSSNSDHSFERNQYRFYAAILLIAGEVILINFLNYAMEAYLPREIGPYLSIEIFYCLPLIQAARLIAIHVLHGSGNFVVTAIAIAVAVGWTLSETLTHPEYPAPLLLLNSFTRGVGLTLIGRLFLTLWVENHAAHRHINTQTVIADSLRINEDKLSKALTMAKAGSWDYDLISDTFIFNDIFYQMLGYLVEDVGSYEMSSAEYIRRFVHPDDAHIIIDTIRVASDQPLDFNVDEIEYRFIYKNSTMGFVKVRFEIVCDETGKIIGAYGVNVDITERKRIEDELLRLNHQLEQLSNIDGLLGIANRRYFDAQLRAEWERAKRDQYPLSMLMIDVDKFKHYNDTYGHQAGDNALKHVASSATDALNRNSDLLARYGGEELVVILPNTTPQGALVVAEKIQKLLASKKIIHHGVTNSHYLTVSIGVATITPTETTTAETLLADADRGLYRAKTHGRNKICLASES